MSARKRAQVDEQKDNGLKTREGRVGSGRVLDRTQRHEGEYERHMFCSYEMMCTTSTQQQSQTALLSHGRLYTIIVVKGREVKSSIHPFQRALSIPILLQ